MSKEGKSDQLEVERKFLLPEPPAWLGEHPSVAIAQGYLVIDDEVEVRLRAADQHRLLTVKRGHGESREEIEVQLSAEQFDALWPLTESLRLRKRRFRVPADGLTAEVDVFEGALLGLVLGEVEFDSTGAADRFEAPPWLGEEVTGDYRYANQTLARSGLPQGDVKARDGIGAQRSVRPYVMSNRTQRALTRAAEDRKIQVAAGTLTAAGAALAGKAGLEALRSSRDGGGPSRAYRLKTREGPKQGIRRIARGRTQDALDHLETSGDEAVHEARKDLKKLRSLLRMVRGGLGKGFYSTENKRFRDAGRRLSAARDAQVKVETLELLQERFSDQLDGVELGAYKKALQDESRAAASEIDPAAPPVAESVEAIALGRNRITGWRLKPPGWDMVGPGLIRTYRRGRKGMERSLADPSGENVHEWRKRAKDLWYQLRILQEAWPELIGPTADQAHGLGDLLGDHHDLEVLIEDIRARRDVAFERRKDAKKLRKLATRRQRELLSQAFDLGERLYAEKPKAFGRRFEVYWLAWRPS